MDDCHYANHMKLFNHVRAFQSRPAHGEPIIILTASVSVTVGSLECFMSKAHLHTRKAPIVGAVLAGKPGSRSQGSCAILMHAVVMPAFTAELAPKPRLRPEAM
jgi:hypothetical protein